MKRQIIYTTILCAWGDENHPFEGKVFRPNSVPILRPMAGSLRCPVAPPSTAARASGRPNPTESDREPTGAAPPWKAALPEDRDIALSVETAWRNKTGLACLEKNRTGRKFQCRKIDIFIIPLCHILLAVTAIANIKQHPIGLQKFQSLILRIILH